MGMAKLSASPPAAHQWLWGTLQSVGLVLGPVRYHWAGPVEQDLHRLP